MQNREYTFFDKHHNSIIICNNKYIFNQLYLLIFLSSLFEKKLESLNICLYFF